MNKIVHMMSISIDGYFARSDGSLDWQQVDAELHADFNRRLAPLAGFLDGRVTWELMAGYWPTADEQPDAAPAEREFAGIWRDMPKVVYSTTLQEAGWNTTIERSVDPERLSALLRESAGDLAVGGANLLQTFMTLDLIDEYWLYVHPVVLGGGRRLFGSTPASLRLVESQAFGNGVVLLRYERL